jgi:LPS-assembly lipoprotein
VWPRRTLLLGLGAALGACNFRPLYLAQGPGDAAVHTELAAIELRGLDGRLGYMVRNALLDELNPATADVPPRYVLYVRLRSRARALGLQLDNTITRYNLMLTAAFELRDKVQNDVLYASRVQRVASYNVSREPYADLIASQEAERRAAQEVATNIRTLLAVQFARTPAVT